MSSKFVEQPSAEKKKIRELKYTLYVHANDDHISGECSWAFLILDRYENKTILSGKESVTDKNRIHLMGIIEGLRWIHNSTEPKYRKYINIELCCDNVYVVNLIREWIDLWENDIDQRPNSDLVKEIKFLKDAMKIKTKWTSKTLNEFSWIVNKKANEILDETN